MRLRRSSNRRGGALIEFALMLPVFLIATLALIEFATLFFLRHAMLNAARYAVRSYSIRELDATETAALANQRLPAINVNFTVTVTPDSDTNVDRYVQVSCPLSEATLGDPLGLFGSGDLAVRVTMRQED